MAKEKAKAKDKCKGIPCMGILALILSVVGIYSMILGIKTQFASTLVYNNWTVMIYYLVGVFGISIAKMIKHHSHCK